MCSRRMWPRWRLELPGPRAQQVCDAPPERPGDTVVFQSVFPVSRVAQRRRAAVRTMLRDYLATAFAARYL